MANMTFKTNLLPNSDYGYNLGSIEDTNNPLRWKIHGSVNGAKIFYGTCSTAAGTLAKVVTCPEFLSSDLVVGAIIFVTFTITNSGAVDSITMNVNGTGAKNIKTWRNGAISNIAKAGQLGANQTYLFWYNGTYWCTVNQQDNNTTSFTITANTTDGIWDLTGTNGTNAVTYAIAPYNSQQDKASFDISSTNPSRTDRLNYNGYLYATKLYSGGNEVLTSHQSLAGYLPLTGGTLTGSLNFSGENSRALTWNDATWQQRIQTVDDSTADTNVFIFQQSSDSGSTWTDLMSIKDNGKVIATTFVGALDGNALSASTINLTETTPSSITSYYLTYATGKSGNQTLRANADLYYYDTGTASYLNVGSSSNSGGLTLHNANGKLGNIVSTTFTENRTFTLPNKTGTFALTSDIVDTKVAQNVSTSTKWRKILLHYTEDDTSTASVTSATNQVYASAKVSVSPSNGELRASIFNISDKVTLQYNTTTNALDFVFV